MARCDDLTNIAVGLTTTLPPNETALEWVTRRDIFGAYKTAFGNLAALENNDQCEHPLAKLRTHEDYIEGIEAPFERLKAGRTVDRKPAVVLDVFAGIGTGVVVLKRLGIGIQKVIHVEHDKVATHV